MDEKSIMVNLGDEKAKEISEVIGSKSCNKILSLLAEGELTVSDISKKLKAPLNTVDYNVKKLVKSGLIEKSSHFWSIRGKKMPTYRVSNRKIIISPKKSIVKVFAWVIGLTGLTALTIREFLGEASHTLEYKLANEDVAMFLTRDASRAAMDEAAPVVLTGVQESTGFIQFIAGIGPWEWFLIGAWFAVFLFFTITLINDKRHRI